MNVSQTLNSLAASNVQGNSSSSPKVSKSAEATDKRFSSFIKKSSDISKDVSINDSGDSEKAPVEKTSSDDISKIEKYLKQAGLDDKQIDDIKEKINDGEIDGTDLLAALSEIFSKVQNIKSEFGKLIENISKEISSSISKDSTFDLDGKGTDINSLKDIISNAVSENLEVVKNVLSKFDNKEEIAKTIASAISENVVSTLPRSEASVDSDLKSQIYTELASKIVKGNDDSEMPNLHRELSNLNLYEPVKIEAENGQNAGLSQDTSSESGEKFSSSKDSEILSKILDGEKSDDSNISKTVNFMTQFDKLSGKNTASGINAGLQKLTINKNNLGQDIIKTVKYMEVNDMKDLTVKITPKGLGDVTINLVMEDGKMRAVLTASNKDAYNALNANLPDISSKFSENAIKVQDFSLNLYQEDTTFFKGQNGKENQQGREKKNRDVSVKGMTEDNSKVEDDEYYNDSNVNMLA